MHIIGIKSCQYNPRLSLQLYVGFVYLRFSNGKNWALAITFPCQKLAAFYCLRWTKHYKQLQATKYLLTFWSVDYSILSMLIRPLLLGMLWICLKLIIYAFLKFMKVCQRQQKKECLSTEKGLDLKSIRRVVFKWRIVFNLLLSSEDNRCIQMNYTIVFKWRH